ncbi:MAG: terminase small subunit [Planctomycetota bacterium]|jgi:phage terminase small subunit
MTKKKQKQLNNQEQIFVDEYLVSLDPEEAALKAKYAATTARTKAYQWVSNSKQNPKPYIAQAIKIKMASRSKKTGIKAEQVIQELAKIAFSNIKDFIGSGNEVKDITTLSPDLAAVVESISTTKTGTKITLHNKLKALEDLGKHLGIYEKDNRQQAETLAEFLKVL